MSENKSRVLDRRSSRGSVGYVADQAHMIHDFGEFSGSAPSALWRQELPDAGGFTD